MAVLAATSLSVETYILALADIQDHYAAAASAPYNSIHLLDKSTLKQSTILQGHKNSITALTTAHNLGSRSVLLSAGKDGSVKAWDERSATIAIEMPSNGKPLLSCDASIRGFLVAAGTEVHDDEASIVYWDPRNPVAPLRTQSSTHSDDITTTKFSQASPTSLLSASSDGLLSISNPQEDDEDEVVLHVGNWGCSISRAGWTRDAGEARVWAASDMETFSTWTSELTALQNLDRERLSPDGVWRTDYIIDCSNSRSGQFNIFAGSNSGDFSIWGPSSPFDRHSEWAITNTYPGQHDGIVRSVLWDEVNGVLLSGGEDAKICAWSLQSSTPAADDNVSSSRKRHRDEFDDVTKKPRATFQSVP